MNTSLQAAGRLGAEFANAAFSWRTVVVWIAPVGLSTRLCVFESVSEEDAHLAAEIIENYEFGCGTMHYYVGEVG